MSRYIDADKLEFETKLLKDNENELTGMNGVALIGKRAGKTIQLYRELFKQMIENAPIEDVVPRSEVEKAKQKVAREIFDILEEIFKKYEQLYKNEMCELLFEDIGSEIYSLKKYIGE